MREPFRISQWINAEVMRDPAWAWDQIRQIEIDEAVEENGALDFKIESESLTPMKWAPGPTGEHDKIVNLAPGEYEEEAQIYFWLVVGTAERRGQDAQGATTAER